MDETISTLRIEIGASSDAARREIDKVTNALQNLRNNSRHTISIDSKDVDSAHKKVGALSNILNSLKRIAFYRAIRSAIKAISKAFMEGAENAYWFSKAVGGEIGYLYKDLTNLSSASFKMSNQLGASFATLLSTVTPILIQLISLITRAADIVTQFFALLGGKTVYAKAIDYTKEWAKQTGSGAKAAKEWKNQLLGFDEINRLEEPSNGGGGSGSALPDYANMFEEAPIAIRLQNIAEMVKHHLAEIELFASGALLGVGLILTLTGANVPLGLGLMVAGAAGIAHATATNWGWITENVINAISSIEMAAAGLLFGIGAVLAFSGANIPLGIALMATGALGAANIVALTWNEIPKRVKNAISAINVGVGLGLLAVGAVLAFSGANIPLGIGLIVAGLGLTGVGAKLVWDEIPKHIRMIIAEVGLYLSLGMTALGAILAFSGVNIPLGIGLMAIGLTSMAINAKVNWKELSQSVRDAVSAVAVVLGASLIVIGAILAFSGANMPLGIGLIAAGIVSSGTAIALNWSYIYDHLSSVLGEIAYILGLNLLGIGALLTFSGVNLPLGIGLMAAGAVALGTAVAVNWDTIKQKLQGPLGEVEAMIGAASLVLGILMLLSGNIPLGLGLIGAGAISLVTAAAANWDNLKQIGADALAKVKEGWDAAVADGLEFVAKVKNDAEKWWTDVKTWWGEKVGKVKEFNTNVKNDAATWWGSVKGWWSARVGDVDSFTTNLVDDSATWWSNAVTWWNGAKQNTLEFSVSVKNEAAQWWSNVKAWWDANVGTLWTTLSIQLPKIEVVWHDWFSVFGNVVQYPEFKITWGSDDIPAYALGGFPEDGLFYANHGEMVGQFSNGKTAVANNEQITSGIATAVYEAFMDAFTQTRGNGSDGTPVNIYLDGREIARTTTKYQNQMARAGAY